MNVGQSEWFHAARRLRPGPAGLLPEAAARLAGTVARWLQLLACIPQRIFPLGPIPLITPRLKIGLGEPAVAGTLRQCGTSRSVPA
jgi:hypothetical protein